jgi:hypothetical protein
LPTYANNTSGATRTSIDSVNSTPAGYPLEATSTLPR